MLYDICCWWFFFYQGNRWTKFLVHSKIRRPKFVPWCLRFWSLWTVFSCRVPVKSVVCWMESSRWLPIWLRSQAVVPCFILCHILTQKLVFFFVFFFCVETFLNNGLNCRRVVVFGRLWANTVSTLNTAFSLTNVHRKCWIHCLLISSTPLQLQFMIAQNEFVVFWGVFLLFSRTDCRIWAI